MNKLILDPGLFEISEGSTDEDQLEHFFFLSETIDFIASFIDGTIDQYNGAPYNFYFNPDDNPQYCDPPITRSPIIKTQFCQIQKKLLKLLLNGERIDSLDVTISNCSMRLDSNTITTDAFKKYLYFLFAEEPDSSNRLLFLSKANEASAPIVNIEINDTTWTMPAVSNPAIDCHQIVGSFLKSSYNENEVFPWKLSCHKLNGAFIHQTSESNLQQRRGLITIFGRETASRNHYIHNQTVSRKNPQYIVYSHENGQYFMSIDLEHGGLEMFSRHGNRADHMGEYNYSCELAKNAQPQTHRLEI